MFDFYPHLSGQAQWTAAKTPGDFVSGFVDFCTVRFGEAEKEPDERERQRKKNDARGPYVKSAAECDQFVIPSVLGLEGSFETLPDMAWIGLEIRFTLESPWYSKDDRPFHVLDNPVRKDRVFGVPFMSAASWKGLLRWACRNLGDSDDWIRPLFGNERDEKEDFQRGALVFYPTWFLKLGFELINPHSRKTRAGTQPIYYEVVPPGTSGVLRLLYAPLPGAAWRDKLEPGDNLDMLTLAIERLLTTYGISAKRTVGWGTASITEWAAPCGTSKIKESTRDAFVQKLRPRAELQESSCE